MKSRACSFVLAVACALVPAAGAAPAAAPAAAPPATSAFDAAAVDAWLDGWAEPGFLSGCVLAAVDGEVVYERCLGLANRELGVPNGPETLFAIASVTKALHQILLARLVDAGALTLDDPIGRWLPDFPGADEITVRQLATHTAGIPHRVTGPGETAVARTAADMLELVKEAERLGPPGGEEVYSSAGYSVLARVLELAGGAPWHELMEREVFAPAGMEHTVHPADRRLIPGRADSYEWTPDGFVGTQPQDLSYLVGAGSLYSTPRDLLRAVRAVVGGGYGATAQEYLLTDGSLRSNGLTGGYRAYVDHDAGTGITLIVCANVTTGALTRLRTALPDVIAGGGVPDAALPDFTGMRVEGDLEDFRGTYRLRPGRDLGVRPAGSHLDVDGWMLMPLGGDAFLCVQDFARVVFQRDADGAVHGIRWGEHPMPRVGDAPGNS